MKLYDLQFNRKFSSSSCRRLRLNTGCMNFNYDFINDKRSDLHPVINNSGKYSETAAGGIYTVKSFSGGSISRLIGEFFPYYTYSAKIERLASASVGFAFIGENISLDATVDYNGDARVTFCGKALRTFKSDFCEGDTFEVTFRAGGISLYIVRGSQTYLIGDIAESDADGKIKDIDGNGLSLLLREDVFKKIDACFFASLKECSEVSVSDVSVFLADGIAKADIRPMKYEDGTPITLNGRVFLTASERLETGAYQSVLSWSPTTSDIRIEGALFFDLGDGIISNDVASSVIYDRNSSSWYIWFCAFSHGHILARAKVPGDLRHGISIIDAQLMKTDPRADLTSFYGFFGDEDPDLVYANGEWNLAICRHESDGYHYYRFVSDNPLDNFHFADKTDGSEKTGGSFVNFEGSYFFVCGSDFKKRSVYDVYELCDFKSPHPLLHRHCDGGFRGWGSVFGMYIGTRKKYFHITFDRFLASSKWNWSYGNIYVFESEEYFR